WHRPWSGDQPGGCPAARRLAAPVGPPGAGRAVPHHPAGAPGRAADPFPAARRTARDRARGTARGTARGAAPGTRHRGGQRTVTGWTIRPAGTAAVRRAMTGAVAAA